MDLATVLSVVQTILTAIQTLVQLQPMFFISDCKRELDDLHNTVETVKAVLEDADAKQDSLNSQEKHYIKELRDAVYDADNVLDEFLTLAKQKKLIEAGGKVSDKVKSFFSRFKLLTHNLSSKVKMVNKKLDAIATKSSKFSFKVEYKPVKFTKEETSSFLCDKIIGRDEDVEKIVGMLLGCDNNVDTSGVSFLAIVGMGGLGKTALAQLVFNDPRISEAFEMKSWTCIADQNQEQWDLKGFLGKVVKGSPINNLTSLEEIHHEVTEKMGGKKYLLVLDDLWTESYHKWQQLEGFLKVGQRGSWIIVTTRSRTTAQMIGGDQVHELRGLSEVESWNLFERIAFQAKEREDDFVKLGKEIVKKCTNVPLAIRVVGSLLRGQSKSKWLSFQNSGLDNISERNDTLTTILKLSYDQLSPPLKTCFAYCAIFPKDWEISKQMLINLWMAQGYINLENLGEEYFLMLLQRCFFQDVHENKLGEIKWFKMHDLLHDIAEQVAGEEIWICNNNTSNVGKGVRHLSLVNNCYTQHVSDKTQIRTYLQVKKYTCIGSSDQLLASKSIPKWTCLRSLDLRNTRAESLPESIGQLLHLRCLDLSWSGHLKMLPKSITKLVNLQTIDLHRCSSLKQLPNDVSKLVDLSTLNVAECDALSCMPSGIGMLTCLHTLGQFVVGVQASSSSKQCFGGLEDLRHLNKLKGSLDIQIGVLKNAKFVKEEHVRGAYLRRKEHLKEIDIEFKRGPEYESKENDQALLEEMQPHHDLMKLKLKGYHGETLPKWPRRGDNSILFDLPNLVSLIIHDCRELVCLPWQVGKLPHLIYLRISRLLNMEYVVDVESETHVSGERSSFFPSLDELTIFELPKLKGWWWRSESGLHVVKPDDGGSNQEAGLVWVSSPCFPLLKWLVIKNCQKMTYVPVCPRLEYLIVYDSRRLLWKNMRCTPRHQPSLSPSYSKPMILRVNNLEWPKSMPAEYFQFIAAIEIESEETLETLGDITELLPTCLLSSLRFLGIRSCPKLRSMGGWLEHLSALQCLRIYDCPNLLQSGIPWQHFPETLQSLCLESFKEMEELPEGMQYCTSLQSLEIRDCPKLECLPKWMPKLTSLEKLQLRMCSKRLEKRCQQPNGEDWSLIQHIPLTCILSVLQEREKKKSDHEPWTNENYWC
ncbi:putative disease resistance protein RGA1 [Silene latifolia]|uniref:putative disease resistance protein RGA1 n=1 Tax=Silene latifolia TaxID=37657 RepID=UPI003D77DEF0